MPYAVRSQRNLLSVIAKSPRKQRRIILRNAKKPLIDAIAECVENTLHGNVKLNKSQKARLARHSAKLRKIANKRISWKTKRDILVQEGGSFFSFLFPLVSSIIGNITGGSQ